MKEISDELYANLEYLGIIENDVRGHNVGKSNYAKHIIQPWTVWLDYPDLTSWDDDIIKRILRTKEEEGMSINEARKMDYEKIIHDCQERIRQIDVQEKYKKGSSTAKKGKQYLCIKDFCIDEGDRVETLFTEGFYYNATEDNIIVANDGLKANINEDVFNEYFIEVK